MYLNEHAGPEIAQRKIAQYEEEFEQYEKDLAAYEEQQYIPPSYLQRIGSTVQPVFAPLGYNDELTVGVLASFAAREVFVSTMAVQVAGNDDIEDESVLEMIKLARRDDGSPIFNAPTAWSLLVFYVFASLCLPTTVVTAKESGGWRWAFLQLGWMSLVAYAGAFVAYTIVGSVGG
jgi:ferrous iron transport protein B